MTTFISIYTVIVLFLASALGVGTLGEIDRNWGHVAEREHESAWELRHDFKTGQMAEYEVWVSPSRGTVLGLGRLEGSEEWIGVVWRVFEYRKGGIQLIPEGQKYLCTAMVKPRQYWNRTIARDGYIPLWANRKLFVLLKEWMYRR